MELAIAVGIDLVLLVVFILFVKIYSDRGLVKSLIGLLGNILALAVALVLSQQLGDYINMNFVHEPTEQWLINTLSPTAGDVNAPISGIDFDRLFSDMPDFFTNTLAFLGADAESAQRQYETFKQSTVDQAIEQARAGLINSLIEPLAASISRVIAFIILFIACVIAVKILWWLSDLIANVPIVRRFDRLGGTIVGVIAGCLIIFILVSVLKIVLPFALKDLPSVHENVIVSRTFVYRNLLAINPLNALFSEWNA